MLPAALSTTRRRNPACYVVMLALLGVPVGASAAPRRNDAQHFKVDPVADGTLIVAGFGFSLLEELILSTGEIVPQPPATAADLLRIDRIAVTQHIDPHARRNSTIGLVGAIGYALVDPLVSWVRGGADAAAVDVVMYAESLSLTWTITDITKIAVRRPRPSAYIAQAMRPTSGTAEQTGSALTTDSELSFFSGHASIVASVSATATYLAFVRAPRSIRAWATLSAGALLTAAVSFERVRAGAHFPTDVIAGSLAGACVGVLVPHLHRHEADAPSIWIGLKPGNQGGTLGLTGRF
jgi:membrane-associated phospholipid phosphatase